MTIVGKIIRYIKEDIWKIPTKHLPKKKTFFIKQLRIILLAFRGFDEDKCNLRASALTFYSVLSIVPIIAMIFAIAKGFGFEQSLEQKLIESFEGQEEVMNWILTFAQSMLENTKGGIIAGIGIIILFWSILKVLGNIEKSFNEIWEIKKSRAFIRKFTDYIAILIFAPIFIVLSSSVTVFISAYLKDISASTKISTYVTPLLGFVMKLTPYFLISLLLTFLYMVMPNTKVKFKSALIAGIVAGILFQLTQWGYVNFQVGVAKYNAIYGSFAALPLFLIWMQLSWLIVLFGAELSFANQNVNRYEFEVDVRHISHNNKIIISLLIVNLVIKNFEKGEKAFNAEHIIEKLEIPTRLANSLLYELVESGVLSEINTKHYNDCAYQPGKDINKLTINKVIEKLNSYSECETPFPSVSEMDTLTKSFTAFKELLDNSADNKLLKDL